jgi:hypothetical protein
MSRSRSPDILHRPATATDVARLAGIARTLMSGRSNIVGVAMAYLQSLSWSIFTEK